MIQRLRPFYNSLCQFDSISIRIDLSSARAQIKLMGVKVTDIRYNALEFLKLYKNFLDICEPFEGTTSFPQRIDTGKYRYTPTDEIALCRSSMNSNLH